MTSRESLAGAQRSYGRATIWQIAWSARRPRQKRNDHRWRSGIGPWSNGRARPSRLGADAAFLGALAVVSGTFTISTCGFSSDSVRRMRTSAFEAPSRIGLRPRSESPGSPVSTITLIRQGWSTSAREPPLIRLDGRSPNPQSRSVPGIECWLYSGTLNGQYVMLTTLLQTGQMASRIFVIP